MAKNPEIVITPKARMLLRKPEDIAIIREATRNPALIDAINTTLAELAWTGMPEHELKGATRFARELTQITEPTPKSKPLPSKPLIET